MDSKVLQGLLNPVRMKILQVAMSKERFTSKEIKEILTDIPQASLYRHINKMVQDQILEVCEENKIRGTVERVMRIKNNPMEQIEQAVATNDTEQLKEIFNTFAISLMMDFNNYMDKPYDLVEDRVGFRYMPLYLSQEECDQFMGEVRSSLSKILDNQPNQERQLRKFSYVFMPVEEQ